MTAYRVDRITPDLHHGPASPGTEMQVVNLVPLVPGRVMRIVVVEEVSGSQFEVGDEYDVYVHPL